MKKEIYLLHSCDAWHSYASQHLLGVFTEIEKAYEYLEQMAEEHNITEEDFRNIKELNQTQNRDTNFMILTESLNPVYEK